jgi:hypothetical protein
VDARELAGEAARDDDDERAQEPEREPALPPRLPLRDHRREEDPGREVRGRDEEDRQLEMPGPDEVVRQPVGEVEAKEARDLGAIVLRRGADEGLDEKQRRHGKEEPDGRALRRGERDVTGRSKRERLLLAPVPTEKTPASESPEE